MVKSNDMIEVPAISLTDFNAEKKEAETLVSKVPETAIKTAEQYGQAAEFLKEIKGKANRLEDLRKSITRPMDTAKKNLMDLFRPTQDLLANAEARIKRSITTYQVDQERLAREEQARLQDKANKEAEKLRQKAQEAADKGKTAKAEELAQKAAEKQQMTPTVVANVPTVAGISSRKVWKFEIVDQALIPNEYTIPDTAKIGRIVRASSGSLFIPGVRIYSEASIGAGA